MTSICVVAILDPRLKAATYLTNICGMGMSETQLIFPNLPAIICWVIIHLTVMSQYLTFVRCNHTSQHCLPIFGVLMVLCFRPFLLKIQNSFSFDAFFSFHSNFAPVRIFFVGVQNTLTCSEWDMDHVSLEVFSGFQNIALYLQCIEPNLIYQIKPVSHLRPGFSSKMEEREGRLWIPPPPIIYLFTCGVNYRHWQCVVLNVIFCEWNLIVLPFLKKNKLSSTFIWNFVFLVM